MANFLTPELIAGEDYGLNLDWTCGFANDPTENKITVVQLAGRVKIPSSAGIDEATLTPCELYHRGLALLRTVACVTKLFGGTSSVSQTLPPIVDPRPMTMRPRMVAPA